MIRQDIADLLAKYGQIKVHMMPTKGKVIFNISFMFLDPEDMHFMVQHFPKTAKKTISPANGRLYYWVNFSTGGAVALLRRIRNFTDATTQKAIDGIMELQGRKIFSKTGKKISAEEMLARSQIISKIRMATKELGKQRRADQVKVSKNKSVEHNIIAVWEQTKAHWLQVYEDYLNEENENTES